MHQPRQESQFWLLWLLQLLSQPKPRDLFYYNTEHNNNNNNNNKQVLQRLLPRRQHLLQVLQRLLQEKGLLLLLQARQPKQPLLERLPQRLPANMNELFTHDVPARDHRLGMQKKNADAETTRDPNPNSVFMGLNLVPDIVLVPVPVPVRAPIHIHAIVMIHIHAVVLVRALVPHIIQHQQGQEDHQNQSIELNLVRDLVHHHIHIENNVREKKQSVANGFVLAQFRVVAQSPFHLVIKKQNEIKKKKSPLLQRPLRNRIRNKHQLPLKKTRW
jgi:hypothetical protein